MQMSGMNAMKANTSATTTPIWTSLLDAKLPWVTLIIIPCGVRNTVLLNGGFTWGLASNHVWREETF